MRKKLQTALKEALSKKLAKLWPDLRPLDPKNESFNGVFGYRLFSDGRRSYFLTITPHDEADMFRATVAWGATPTYPSNPFYDLRASKADYVKAESAELQLAQLAEDSVPYEWHLDPEYEVSRKKADAISARVARGEQVSTEEYLKSLPRKPGAVEDALKRIEDVAETLCNTLRRYLPLRA